MSSKLNPFTDKLLLNINSVLSSQAERLPTDMKGRIVARRTVAIDAGMNTVNVNGLAFVSKGAYLLKVQSETIAETVKVVNSD